MPDFEDRIALFGLTSELPTFKDLIIPDNETHYLSQVKPETAGARWHKDLGRIMKPKDFAQLKAWIGVPDATAKKLAHAPKFLMRRRPQPAHLVPEIGHREKVEYAKAFVFGNSAALVHVNLDINDILQHIIVHFARDIVVGHNATLVYGPDNHAVQARHIKIQTGGQIVANSYMSINCTSLAAKLA